MSADADGAADDGAGAGAVPDRAADDRRRPRGRAVRGRVRDLRPRQRAALGEALHDARDALPMFRGQNEQGMALAGVAYAKALHRRRIMVATSSVGPGATNMVTAAAVAHANRLPLLLLAGDTFASRLPDPVLQQVEQFGEPSTTVNDAFRPVDRYWDRIRAGPAAAACRTRSRPCSTRRTAGPRSSACRRTSRPRPTTSRPRSSTRSCTRSSGRGPRAHLAAAAALLAAAERPLIVAGGGVHYSEAEADLREFADRHGIPVVETMAGKASLVPATACWSARRRDRVRPGEPDRRRGRRRARGRHAPAGLHDRLVDGVRRRRG